MIEFTTDASQAMPDKIAAARVTLTLHRNAPRAKTRPATRVHCERHPDAPLIGTPLHQPTPAECYGCVDWFQF